jgi:uncharacterized protein YndB with AHSA1/START domain
MIKKGLLGLAGLIVILLLVAAFKSPDFRVERSRSIAAPASALFEQVNDHHKFNTWNPFMKMDPNAKNTFSGPEAGVGAVCAWDGDKVGAGKSTIIESKPNELVRLRMDWLRPMEGTSTVDFTIKPDGDRQRITWSMYGRSNFIGRLMSIFMNCESMCGPPFEQGLADLEKTVTTATPSPAAK